MRTALVLRLAAVVLLAGLTLGACGMLTQPTVPCAWTPVVSGTDTTGWNHAECLE